MSSMRFPFFWFVISYVFDVEIMMHMIPEFYCTHIIPVFSFDFQADFLNSYSLNLRHEAFHHVTHYHTILLLFTSLYIRFQRGGTLSDKLPINQFTIR